MSDETLALLDRERQELLLTVERVPIDQRSERPAGDRWSIAEVLEHLATVERGIGKLLALRGRESPSADAPPATPLDAERIAQLRSRDQRREAPERVRPTGTMSAADALQGLLDSRTTLRDAVIAADPQALDGCTHSHPVLGVLTLRDWVHFVAHHEARHVDQLAEIADALLAASGENGGEHNLLSPRIDS